MTTFQAIIYAALHGFAEFLPISPAAHEQLLLIFLDWPMPSGTLAVVIAGGAASALFVHFRHDWASIISSALQVVLFWKKPMTLDERLPLFIGLSTIPITGAFAYLKQSGFEFQINPLLIAGMLIIFSAPLFVAERWSKRNKKMFDWNWVDAFLIGIAQLGALVPGVGAPVMALAVASFRHYNREAAIKYVLLALFPLLVAQTVHRYSLVDASEATASIMTLCVAFLVSFIASLLAIGALTKNASRSGYGGFLVYRVLIAVGAVITYLLHRPSL